MKWYHGVLIVAIAGVVGLLVGTGIQTDEATVKESSTFNYSSFASQGFKIIGEDFIQANQKLKRSLVTVVPSFFVTKSLMPGAGRYEADLLACVDRMNFNQHVAILDKYLKDNPELLHHSLNQVMVEAFTRACDQ